MKSWRASLACWLVLPAAVGTAQQAGSATIPAHIVNAQLAVRAATPSLSQAIQSELRGTNTAFWIGYAVPAINVKSHMCCGETYVDSTRINCGPCSLEDGSRTNSQTVTTGGPETVQLEAAPLVLILLRADGGKLEKLRTFSSDCTLDAGGKRVVWLTDVQPAQSVGWLRTLVEQHAADQSDDDDGADHLWSAALMAIASHADSSADQALTAFADLQQPVALRSKAMFWLGATRGESGLKTLQAVLHRDPDDRVRDKAVFAVYVNKAPESTATLIDAAKHDSSAHVRGQALFWLGQRAGQRAEQAITEAIRNDPETEVKKKAVFALSQLPRDEGVPLLIQVARTNTNPAVRKQAMFWLGQSHDPRALTFFEEVLR